MDRPNDFSGLLDSIHFLCYNEHWSPDSKTRTPEVSTGAAAAAGASPGGSAQTSPGPSCSSLGLSEGPSEAATDSDHCKPFYPVESLEDLFDSPVKAVPDPQVSHPAPSQAASAAATEAPPPQQPRQEAGPLLAPPEPPSAASSGGNIGLRAPVKVRRRVVFSTAQLNALNARFYMQKHLVKQQMVPLAAEIGLTYKQVKTWFQNRRMSERRRERREKWEAEHPKAQRGNRRTPQRNLQRSQQPQVYLVAPVQNQAVHQAGGSSYQQWSQAGFTGGNAPVQWSQTSFTGGNPPVQWAQTSFTGGNPPVQWAQTSFTGGNAPVQWAQGSGWSHPSSTFQGF